jgi:glycosyltransferase involved in cell wall biosynthesis
VNINDYSLSKWDVQKKTSEKKVVFVGKLDYFPNQDAAALICTEIAPFAQDIKFIIVGSGRMENIKIPPNVHFTGYVSDTKPYVADADLCICPIRYGAGTRFKIIEYMALKKPVIATSKGAEGLEVTDGKNIIIEDKIENYPHIIKNLIFDAGDCERIGAAARKLIELKYDWQKYANVLRDVYEKTL